MESDRPGGVVMLRGLRTSTGGLGNSCLQGLPTDVNFSYERVPEPVLGEAASLPEQTANLQTALLHLD